MGVFIMINKIFGALFACLLSLLGMVSSAHAVTTPPDFTTLTAAVDYTTVSAAVLLIMASLAGLYILMAGGSMILAKLKGGK
jgi:hypothetical protein